MRFFRNFPPEMSRAHCSSSRDTQAEHPAGGSTVFDILTINEHMPRLGELDAIACDVGISCPRCHRTVTVGVGALRSQYGTRLSASDAASRMTCDMCGSKGLSATIRMK
jgi:hypothetical protein